MKNESWGRLLPKKGKKKPGGAIEGITVRMAKRIMRLAKNIRKKQRGTLEVMSLLLRGKQRLRTPEHHPIDLLFICQPISARGHTASEIQGKGSRMENVTEEGT